MKKHLLKLAFVFTFGLMSAIGAKAQIVIVRPNHVMRGELRGDRPSRRHQWREGEWAWRNGNYNWTAGGWEIPARGHRWRKGHWGREHGGYRWHNGGWR